MSLRQAAQQALEALVQFKEISDFTPAAAVHAITALRSALAEPEQEPVDSPEKAGAYMDARLWEFIDMAAAWPETSADSRTWDHVMVYAPTPRKPLTDEEISVLWEGHTVPVFGKTGINPVVFARAIERAHGIGEQHE